MQGVRIVFSSLMKRKIPSIFIAIQVAISIGFFITVAFAIQQVFYLNLIVPKNIDAPLKQTVHLKPNIQTATPEKYFTFRERAFREWGITFMGSYKVNKSIIINSLVDSLELDNLRKDLIKSSREGNYFFPGELSTIQIEQGMEALKKLEVIKGRFFKKSDFERNSKSSVIPVLAGYQLEDYGVLDVGSELQDENNQVYRVIGILKKDSTWFMFTPTDGSYLNINDKLVIALNDQDYYPFVPGKMPLHYYCGLDDKVAVDQVEEGLEKLSREIGIPIDISTLKEELDKSYQTKFKKNIRWLIFSVFFVVMTSLGIASILLSSVLSRKEEIGIRMAMGASMGKIQRLFTGEIVVVILLSSIVGILYSIYSLSSKTVWYDEVVNGFHLSPVTIGGAVGVSLLMGIAPIAIIMYRLRRLQPRELIGGKE